MDSSSRLFVNATSGTHSCFDKKTYAGEVTFTSWSPKTLRIHQQLHFLEAMQRLNLCPWLISMSLLSQLSLRV
ncbi:BnaA09g29330D [Brassica napus]|uniref:(rape) hypothetical protein n=1 Tax=Brassica napus TaxID=3708 RepID=A0A078FTE3_BRANA|nr:unnamed protein product [Brassica napus]CDY16199.1 BnaA09g29330D [Brassica napus]